MTELSFLGELSLKRKTVGASTKSGHYPSCFPQEPLCDFLTVNDDQTEHCLNCRSMQKWPLERMSWRWEQILEMEAQGRE